MAETSYDGTDDWSDTQVSQNGDGTSTFWDNSFKRLANRVKRLGRSFGTAGEPPASGSLDKQTAPDGTTLIGFSGYSSVAATTLRALLVVLIDYIELLVPLTGYDPVVGGDADTTFSAAYKTVNAAIANTNRTYSIDLSNDGEWIEIHRRDSGTGNLIIKRLGSANNIVTFVGGGAHGARIQVRGGVAVVQSVYGNPTLGTEA